MTPLVSKALEIAASQIGVREKGKNRGPEVDAYVMAAGLDPNGGYPWCAAFVYWCFRNAAMELGVPNPCPRTARVGGNPETPPGLWDRALFYQSDQPSTGAVFVIVGKKGGHTGFVEHLTEASRINPDGSVSKPGVLITIEGNTNEDGSREGIGVFRRTRLPEEITGYLDFSREAP